jgi:CRP/FNR family transcriptional regulator, nitrogen oxide reductase regulator
MSGIRKCSWGVTLPARCDLTRIDNSVVGGLDIFSGLSNEDIDAILDGARSSWIARETAVFEQDGEADAFFLLLDGAVRVVRVTPDGQQIIARYIGVGDLFGIAPAIGRTTYPASAVAATDCVVLSWPTSLWAPLAQRFPVFAANTYKLVGARLQETQEHVVELSTQQVEQRVAHAVLRLVRQTGRQVEGGVLIDFPLSRQDIAEMTGTTLHTVSRILSAWEGKGLVKSSRQKVTVTDPHGLVMLAEGYGGKA